MKEIECDKRRGGSSRRRLLQRGGCVIGSLLFGGFVADAVFERHWVELTGPYISVPDLPAAFEGLTICQLTDIHHGPYLEIHHVEAIVDRVLALQPDLIVLTGDMIHRGPEYIEPVWQQLSRLEAAMGVYSVTGNHEHYHGVSRSRHAATSAGAIDLNNRSVPVTVNGDRIWLAGIDDWGRGTPRPERALRKVAPNEPIIFLSHNPDFADHIHDERIKLILAGHSHGGQVVLPLMGPVVLPCKRKYAQGLVETETGQIYISRGIGMAVVPVRMNCRPELPLIMLKGTG